MKNIVTYLLLGTQSNRNIALFFEHNIYGDIMRLFSYHKKIISLILIITIIALFIHTITCLDIKKFKRAVSSITKNYNLFIYIYPIIYILLGIGVYRFCFAFENSKNVYIILLLYFAILILTSLSSILSLRYANFIFSFWCIVLSTLLDVILSYLLSSNSFKLVYLNGIHVTMYSYLSVVTFWLYFQNI